MRSIETNNYAKMHYESDNKEWWIASSQKNDLIQSGGIAPLKLKNDGTHWIGHKINKSLLKTQEL